MKPEKIESAKKWRSKRGLERIRDYIINLIEQYDKYEQEESIGTENDFICGAKIALNATLKRVKRELNKEKKSNEQNLH